MHRRDLLKNTAALAAGTLAAGHAAGQEVARTASPTPAAPGRRFKLHYAPHLGMFKHHAGDDPFDQLRFMADEGFTAFEDNWMTRREPAMQEQFGKALEGLGMKMGVFVAHADFGNPTFVLPPAEARERIEADMKQAVETAKRCNAKWCTVVPGTVKNNQPLEYQTANVIDNLRFAAEILEPAGLCAVLEPLNPWVNHPGLFLYGIPQAYLVCRGADSPSIKILDDLYHQQITEGHLIRNLDHAWSEIAYIQVGDNPGRKEPGTGEINYLKVFGHLHGKGFEGVVGMEHGNSGRGKEGERAVIDAYAAADAY